MRRSLRLALVLVGLLRGWCPLGAAAEQEGAPTFSSDVAPLLQRRCQECHRPRGAAPFSLLTFEQARAWGRRIGEVVANGSMPPWHADPAHGEFANDRRLLPCERTLILDWVRSGMAQGNIAALPAPRVFADGWRIGEPDVVIELPEEVVIPAVGEVPYHDYQVDFPFDEDVWVIAAEARPGNPRVVHHIIVESYLAGPRALTPGEDPRTVGSLGGYVPGDAPLVLPPGLGRRIPAGAKISFQLHYTPTGQVERDRSQLGLVLAKEPPPLESRTGIVSTPFLWIPAGRSDVAVTAKWRFPSDAVLVSMRPHLHLRGKTFTYTAHFPNGTEEILLRVADYDFDWQTTYVLAEPKPMPAGSELVCVATYDNSSANPSNPDPTRDVSWGEQTTDEMMIGFFDYYFVEPVAEWDR